MSELLARLWRRLTAQVTYTVDPDCERCQGLGYDSSGLRCVCYIPS